MSKNERKSNIRLHSILAIASFVVGTLLGSLCLFAVAPYGEISNSALGLISEFLILAGTLLGFKVNFDLRQQKFEADINHKISQYDTNN